jgi:acetyltransferase-like isoleucine patch superfamily enzyme
MSLLAALFGADYGKYYRRPRRLRDRIEVWWGTFLARRKVARPSLIARTARIAPSALISGDVAIGAETAVMPYTVLRPGSMSIRIGSHCSINPFTCIFGGAAIGDRVRIATHTVIVPAQHRFDDADQPIHGQGITSLGVVIEDDVWIGMNVSILDGVRIGRGAVVGAGAVVTRSVPPMAVVVGNPARVLRFRGEAGNAGEPQPES